MASSCTQSPLIKLKEGTKSFEIIDESNVVKKYFKIDEESNFDFFKKARDLMSTAHNKKLEGDVKKAAESFVSRNVPNLCKAKRLNDYCLQIIKQDSYSIIDIGEFVFLQDQFIFLLNNIHNDYFKFLHDNQLVPAKFTQIYLANEFQLTFELQAKDIDSVKKDLQAFQTKIFSQMKDLEDFVHTEFQKRSISKTTSLAKKIYNDLNEIKDFLERSSKILQNTHFSIVAIGEVSILQNKAKEILKSIEGSELKLIDYELTIANQK